MKQSSLGIARLMIKGRVTCRVVSISLQSFCGLPQTDISVRITRYEISNQETKTIDNVSLAPFIIAKTQTTSNHKTNWQSLPT